MIRTRLTVVLQGPKYAELKYTAHKKNKEDAKDQKTCNLF